MCQHDDYVTIFCLYPLIIHPFDNAVVKLNNLIFNPSTTLTDRVPLLL